MTTLQTAVGPVEAAALSVSTTTADVPGGRLTTTSYFLDGALVKTDQHLDISEAALKASGVSEL